MLRQPGTHIRYSRGGPQPGSFHPSYCGVASNRSVGTHRVGCRARSYVPTLHSFAASAKNSGEEKEDISSTHSSETTGRDSGRVPLLPFLAHTLVGERTPPPTLPTRIGVKGSSCSPAGQNLEQEDEGSVLGTVDGTSAQTEPRLPSESDQARAFNAAIGKFMCGRGTPISRVPTVGAPLSPRFSCRSVKPFRLPVSVQVCSTGKHARGNQTSHCASLAGDKRLDLYTLYREVVMRGGLELVIQKRMWGPIASVLELPKRW